MRQLLLQNGCQYVFEGKMATNPTDIKFSIAKQTKPKHVLFGSSCFAVVLLKGIITSS